MIKSSQLWQATDLVKKRSEMVKLRDYLVKDDEGYGRAVDLSSGAATVEFYESDDPLAFEAFREMLNRKIDSVTKQLEELGVKVEDHPSYSDEWMAERAAALSDI